MNSQSLPLPGFNSSTGNPIFPELEVHNRGCSKPYCLKAMLPALWDPLSSRVQQPKRAPRVEAKPQTCEGAFLSPPKPGSSSIKRKSHPKQQLHLLKVIIIPIFLKTHNCKCALADSYDSNTHKILLVLQTGVP